MEGRIGIRRWPWETDALCVRSSHRRFMGWGGLLIRPSMRCAAWLLRVCPGGETPPPEETSGYFPFPQESFSATVRLKTAFAPGMWSLESVMK